MTRSTGAVLAALPLVLLGACSAGPAAGPAPAPSPSSAPVTPDPSRTPSRTPAPPPADPVPEPTTTNTLPPPPEPTGPAPSTAGDLTADALPVPAGWRTVPREGGAEEGFQGNGTWVHARDPRYAAQDVITIGCADVTRDDYPDPVAALEGSYADEDGAPGVVLALAFADETAATAYWQRYTAQVEACRTLDDPVRTELVEGLPGLVDRRTYPDGEWTEVGRRTGARVTLVILTDPGHQMTRDQARALLQQLG
ncbi:hypothetical protein GCM10009616_06080 [Microlunatus lacustris]